MLQFHLDENVDPRIAGGLIRFGIAVTTTCDRDLRGASDRAQLEDALRSDSVLVTKDVCMLSQVVERIRAGVETPGVVVIKAGKYSVGDIITRLRAIHRKESVAGLKNRVVFL